MIGIGVDDGQRIGCVPAHGLGIAARRCQPQERVVRHVEQAEVFVELGAKLRFGEGFKVDVHDRSLARGLPNGDSAMPSGA